MNAPAAAVSLRSLTAVDVERILTWRYPGEYAVYDPVAADGPTMLEPANRYRAIERAGELVGYVCTGVEARVPGMIGDAELVDVGLGVRPDRIGRGAARTLVPAVLAALRVELGGDPRFRAVVAEWNGRAQRAIARAGFAPEVSVSNARGRYRVYVEPRRTTSGTGGDGG